MPNAMEASLTLAGIGFITAFVATLVGSEFSADEHKPFKIARYIGLMLSLPLLVRLFTISIIG